MKQPQAIINHAKVGNVSAVARMLRQGGNPNEKDEKNWTPLHWASQEGHLEIVRCLIESCADVNAADNLGFTPLVIAAGHGHGSVVRELLRAGADANKRVRSNANGTALHLACSWGRVRVVKILVESSDVEINARDKSKKTALGYAVDAGERKLATYLKKH